MKHPKRYVPVLGIIEYKEDNWKFCEAAVVFWADKQWFLLYWDKSMEDFIHPKVLCWFPLPKSAQNMIDKLYKEKK